MADESRREARPLESADALPDVATDAAPGSQPLERQLEPLRREVESPRTAGGLWLPFMALASAAMLTITSGIAVMSRPPRVHVDGPEMTLPATAPAAGESTERLRRDVDQFVQQQRGLDAMGGAPMSPRTDRPRRVLCRVAVYRGNLDGDTQPYDECIIAPDVAATANPSAGPEVR